MLYTKDLLDFSDFVADQSSALNLTKFRKSKMYKGQSAAELNELWHLGPSIFFLNDRDGHTLKVG